MDNRRIEMTAWLSVTKTDVSRQAQKPYRLS